MIPRSFFQSFNLVLLCLVLILSGFGPVQASPAGSGARALFFDPSLRSAALGGAGGALWWGGDPNDWANPALLPFNRGLRYSSMQSDLVPQLSTDTRFTSRRLTLAWQEFGLVEGGKIGLADGGRFDMGTQVGVDEWGEPQGQYQPWAETKSLGIGVDLVPLMHRLGWTFLATDRLSLSVGHTWKTYEDLLVPREFLFGAPRGGASASTRDFGVFSRWTPLNSLSGNDHWLDGLGGGRLDLAIAWSRLNYNGAKISYVDQEQADPISKAGHLSGAVTFAAGQLESCQHGSWIEVLKEGLSPLISLAMIYERRDFTIPSFTSGQHNWDDWSCIEHEIGYGAEFSVANIFSYRLGHLDDDIGHINGMTKGWSLGLPLGRFGGFRYDEATMPQSSGLDDVKRTGWTLFVDVLELAQKVRKTEEDNHGTE